MPLASISNTINWGVSRPPIGIPPAPHSFCPTCDLAERYSFIRHRNVIHCAISALIASQRNLWHNYDGAVIDRAYQIDVEECLAYARAIVQERDAFLKSAPGCTIVNCRYESLIDDLERAGSGEEIPEGPGPLRDIAAALGRPFSLSL